MPENNAHFIDTNIWLYALLDTGEGDKLSFWDSMIVAAAFLSGAEIIYSEDMQNGLVIRKNLQIKNPFK